MSEKTEVKPPMTYAEKLRGQRDSDVAAAAQQRKDRKAEIAGVMDRRNAPLADRLATSRARDQLLADEAAAKAADKRAEQSRIGEKLASIASTIQGEQGLSYSERLGTITPPANNISTKDLRSPSERSRDEWAAFNAAHSGDYETFAD